MLHAPSLARSFVLPALALGLLGGSLLCPSYAIAKDAPSDNTEVVTESTAAPLSEQGVFIQKLADAALAILANKKITEKERAARFEKMLDDSFDMTTIGRFVLGRSWRRATAEEKKEYMNLFRGLVIKTYSDRFSLYSGQSFQVVSTYPESDRDVVVYSKLLQPDGKTKTSVNWRVRTEGKKMSIIDVTIERISMSITQHQEYAAIIQRHGGTIEPLLKLMRERTQTNKDDLKQADVKK